MEVNIQDQFDPIQAIKTLRSNAEEIMKLGNEIKEKRLKLSLVKATLADKMKELRGEVFEGNIEIQATKLNDWIKYKSADEQLEVDTLTDEIKVLDGQLQILIEINNTVKFSHKIWEMEMRNLNYQPE